MPRAPSRCAAVWARGRARRWNWSRVPRSCAGRAACAARAPAPDGEAWVKSGPLCSDRTMTGPTHCLEALNLQKRYGERTVVRDVSLSVEMGQVVGLLGPNGAGKTTTFYMVVGVEAPDRGTIRWLGQDVT